MFVCLCVSLCGGKKKAAIGFGTPPRPVVALPDITSVGSIASRNNARQMDPEMDRCSRFKMPSKYAKNVHPLTSTSYPTPLDSFSPVLVTQMGPQIPIRWLSFVLPQRQTYVILGLPQNT